jgi:tripeptide aminopeptidase
MAGMPTWILDSGERQALLQRFLRYVAVDTQSDENATCAPSTEKQKNLGRMLVDELRALGCTDAVMAPSGHVTASLPANLPDNHPAKGRVAAVGFLAHLDTYHGTPGANVKPVVVPDYAGGGLVLPATGARLTPDAHANLIRCVGHTVIHTDGTTLLGADDKAGIAEIMTMLAHLQQHPEFLHGPLCIGFTPDEEIGRGVDGFDLKAFGADYAYTVDGSDLGEVEDETFSADTAVLTIHGLDVHPGRAKGIMVNAVRVAAAIIEALPQEFLPETTDHRQPYLHPYVLAGDVAKVELKLLVRAFSEQELIERENVLRKIVSKAEARFPGVTIGVEVKESYRNMREAIAKDPKVLDYAILAVERQGITPVRRAIRGGTDGSRLSAMGLLTPNIFTGGQAAHSVQEWISLEWMAAAAGVCLQLVAIWVEKSS